MNEDERLCGGNFRLLFEGDDPFRRWLDGFFVWPQSHGSCYSDSSIFVRRDVYDTMGGIRPIAFMEGYDFVRRLEVHGNTCFI